MEKLFKIGDKVVWCGVPGVVVHDYKFKFSEAASLLIEFEEKCADARNETHLTFTFLYDGRLHSWHKEPSLKKR